MPVILLALLLTWRPPLTLCDGAPVQFPEQITYLVEYRVREMVICPEYPDGLGNPQPCAKQTGIGQWVTPGLSLDGGATADPPVGVVFDVQEPVAVNPAGRSDGPCL